MAAKAVDASAPLTREAVEARIVRAMQLAKAGQSEEALREFLWAYDVGMVRITSLEGQRYGALQQIAALGKNYPPALAVLRERRDAAEKRVLLNIDDGQAARLFGSVNQLLNEKERTLAAFDKAPPMSEATPDRRRLVGFVFDELVERRRYQDFLDCRGFALMSSQLESWTMARGKAVPNTGAKAEANWDKWIEGTVRDIEVLAGVGAVADARNLATRLLAADGTEKTRALLQQRLVRAGQPGLLEAGAAGGK